jgi:anti-sigma factor RsiW
MGNDRFNDQGSRDPRETPDARDRDALTEMLVHKLPQFAAPLALKRALRESLHVDRSAVDRQRRYKGHRWQWAASFAIAACVCAIALVWVLRAQSRANDVAIEAADEHVTLLAGAPLSQVTGGLHEVKPWFGGKLDFAPEVTFAGDQEFPLAGGAVTRFFDRRAAVFVFHRRLHVISLFVMRAEHLSLPGEGTIRGFHYRSWASNDEAYIAISDLNAKELAMFCDRVTATNR